MKIVTLLSIIWLLNACNSQIILQANNTNSCPQPTQFSLQQSPQGYFNYSDFQPRNIVTDTNTINFQTAKYDFIFCRTNNSWTVQSGTLPSNLQPPQN